MQGDSIKMKENKDKKDDNVKKYIKLTIMNELWAWN